MLIPASSKSQQKPEQPSQKTIGIIGAGPAGMSAALWLKQLGFIPVVLEKQPQAGGMQRFNFLSNGWVIGQKMMTGVQVADHFFEHLQSERIDVRLGCVLKKLVKKKEGFALHFSGNDHADAELDCAAVVLATGTRFLGREILPEVVNESDVNRIIEGPYAFLNMEALSGQHIMIIGAGDNAFENAQLLLEQGCQVSMIARSEPSAQAKFINEVMESSNFTLHCHSTVNALVNQKECLSVAIVNRDAQEINLTVDCLHILAGYQPNSDSVLKAITRISSDSLCVNANGFVTIDQQGRTSIKGIYAAGDVCNADFPCVVSAVAAGALAAKSISRDLFTV